MATVALLAGLASSTPAFTQTTTPPTKPPAPEAAKLEAWRASMARIPMPKKGCFTAEYPKTEWIEVPCGPPSRHTNQPTGGKRPNTVGGGSGDYSAQSAGLISSAVGSFMSVNGASSVSGPPANGGAVANNVFMFQINTQFFNNPPACSGGAAGCQGWQQFLYSQTQGPPPGGGQQSVVPGSTAVVFMEYWLIGYGPNCPPGQPLPGLTWSSDGFGNCVFNGPSTYVPPQTVNDLQGLVMTAASTGGATGTDTITLATASGNLVAQGQDSVLNLAQFWNTAEFNVFGDCCSTQTSFSNPTTLVIKTSINDGTTNAPTCGTSSYTAETNNLTMATTVAPPQPVCCPYGGASPAIEFMETNAGHTASCGPTKIEGDTHITTADGTHYDFQAAGEFVSLRDRDGTEIQTRQTAIGTTFFPAPDSHDGLATCVSVNTAVAARVGRYRVTYQPHISGVPDPSGLQLRIDGALTTLGTNGLALGGGRLVPLAGGALEVDFPSGKTMLVTPQWWASQGKWFLNVDIFRLGS
jgi:hypothetical protein